VGGAAETSYLAPSYAPTFSPFRPFSVSPFLRLYGFTSPGTSPHPPPSNVSLPSSGQYGDGIDHRLAVNLASADLADDVDSVFQICDTGDVRCRVDLPLCHQLQGTDHVQGRPPLEPVMTISL